MAAQRGIHRYPRPGERIAPATLSQVLAEPAPDYLVAKTPAHGIKLSELDESVWQKLSPEAIAELAEIVVARVAGGCARKVFQGRHFPRPPQGMSLEQLRLEHRTQLCLAREGFDEHPELLGDHTIGEILRIRSFGPRCLVDLLSALESLLTRDRRLDRHLSEACSRLLEVPEAAFVRSDDPRFGAIIHEIDPEARTAGDLAERLLARTLDPPDSAYMAAQVRRLVDELKAMTGQRLEEELIQIFANTSHERNREILIGYYGWADGQCHTLAEIGQRYGMTRERTRQICARLVQRNNPAQVLAPVLDRTLALITAKLPCAVSALEQDLRDAELTAVGMRLENVEVAARLLGRPVPFSIVAVGPTRLAVSPSQSLAPPAVVETAKKEIYYRGASTIAQIVELLTPRFPRRVDAALVAHTLQVVEGFRWLDRASGWFLLASVLKHGLPKAIDKILAVAPRIRVADLQAAVSRNRRAWPTPPPREMLLEFCRQLDGVRVEGDWIVSDRDRDWQDALTGVEAQLVRTLKRHGPVLDRGALEELCVSAGMNRFSFHAFLANSPVIVQHGHSLYGLLGAEVTRESIESLVVRHRTERNPVKVLAGHGRTSDGQIWLSYRLSKAASTYAVVTVPAPLKEAISGKFDLLSSDGHAVGVLAAKDGRAWGLGAFLRKAGARIDDRLVVTLDLDRRRAVVALTGEWIAEEGNATNR